MENVDLLLRHLKQYILGDKMFEAEQLLPKLGRHAAPVFEDLFAQDNLLVKQNVLELAGQLGDPRSCRLFLKALSDPDPDIRGVAAFQLSRCSDREIIPELLEAFETHKEELVKGALAAQIGMVGTAKDIQPLKKQRKKMKEPEAQHQVDLALARLGDEDARKQLIERIQSDIQMARFQALQDCLYVQDKSLAVYFGPALDDYRDVVQVTTPEDSPVPVYARMCDIAVTVMNGLGYDFSFSAEDLWVRKDEELREAKRIVKALKKASYSSTTD